MAPPPLPPPADALAEAGGSEAMVPIGAAPPQADAVARRAMDVALARQVLYDEAVRTRDDVSLAFVRKQMARQTKEDRATATKEAHVLQDRLKQF